MEGTAAAFISLDGHVNGWYSIQNNVDNLEKDIFVFFCCLVLLVQYLVV